MKMVHNGIEYGDMQLISEAYDVLRTVGGLTNEEMVEAFNEWNAVRAAESADLDDCTLCLGPSYLIFKAKGSILMGLQYLIYDCCPQCKHCPSLPCTPRLSGRYCCE